MRAIPCARFRARDSVRGARDSARARFRPRDSVRARFNPCERLRARDFVRAIPCARFRARDSVRASAGVLAWNGVIMIRGAQPWNDLSVERGILPAVILITVECRIKRGMGSSCGQNLITVEPRLLQ